MGSPAALKPDIDKRYDLDKNHRYGVSISIVGVQAGICQHVSASISICALDIVGISAYRISSSHERSAVIRRLRRLCRFVLERSVGPVIRRYLVPYHLTILACHGCNILYLKLVLLNNLPGKNNPQHIKSDGIDRQCSQVQTNSLEQNIEPPCLSLIHI